MPRYHLHICTRSGALIGERLRAMYAGFGQLPIPKRILDVFEELKQVPKDLAGPARRSRAPSDTVDL